MAEFANKRCEDMIPALEQMERIKLFDKSEISAIIKQLKNHELKLQRITKNKEDYLRYIQYMEDLISLIRQRRLKFRINQKKSDIEFSLNRKVSKIYEMVITRFKDDIRLYVAHIAFCNHKVGRKSCEWTITRLLEVHPDKPECWHIAAKWEMKERKNVNTARSYIMRGIHIHPQSQLLYLDAFKLELNAANKNAETETPSTTDENDTPIHIKRALAVYRSASKNIDDMQFTIELLNIAKQHESTKELQNKIILDMLKKYKDDPLMWDTMARRELEGLTYNPAGDESMEVEGAEEKPPLRDRIDSCNEVYQTAVERLKTETMWSLYINCLIKINHQPILPNYKRKLLKNALIQANQAKKLAEKYYLHWIEILKSDKRDETLKYKVYQIACMGTEAFPESVSLWHEKLKYLMNSEQDDLVQSEFDKASKILGANALPLWQMKLIYYQEKFPERVEQFFCDAVNGDPAISEKMRSPYLEWLVQKEGIEAARVKYQELTVRPPTCLVMHKTMANLEILQPEICVKDARKPHELATLQYGKTRTDVWIDYMLFEMEYGDPMKSASIYQRAVKTLEPSKASSFVEEYSLIKANPDAIVRSERV